MEKFERLDQKKVYKGRRVDIYKDILKSPEGKTIEWDLIKHVGAAAIIAVDDEGKILMVKQYRNASDSVTLEIPAGCLDSKEEKPKTCAIRELEEETGYKTDDVEFLFKFYSSIGIMDEVISVFVARNLKPTKQNLDSDEYIDIYRYTVDELINMIFEGKIMDNKTISAILVYKESLNK